MAYSIQPINGTLSFVPAPRHPETATQRLNRLLSLMTYGTPVSESVLQAAEGAAQEESRRVRVTV